VELLQCLVSCAFFFHVLLTSPFIQGSNFSGPEQYDKATKTVTKAPVIPINDLSTESLRNIQEGQGALTRGLMQGFRNPLGHAPMSAVVPAMISEIDCLNVLSLVSYLAAKLEYANSSTDAA
jgi:uncharacterized protein (TIGR02391 family)